MDFHRTNIGFLHWAFMKGERATLYTRISHCRSPKTCTKLGKIHIWLTSIPLQAAIQYTASTEFRDRRCVWLVLLDSFHCGWCSIRNDLPWHLYVYRNLRWRHLANCGQTKQGCWAQRIDQRWIEAGYWIAFGLLQVSIFYGAHLLPYCGHVKRVFGKMKKKCINRMESRRSTL